VQLEEFFNLPLKFQFFSQSEKLCVAVRRREREGQKIASAGDECRATAEMCTCKRVMMNILR
jgi:hypothetical protein